jgi:hypothetical protein
LAQSAAQLPDMAAALARLKVGVLVALGVLVASGMPSVLRPPIVFGPRSILSRPGVTARSACQISLRFRMPAGIRP